MGIFGRVVEIDPHVSQPGAAPYQARGIFSSRPVQFQLQDGAILSDQQTTLGIRLEEFAVPPTNRDRVIIDGVTYWVGDTSLDGQGGATITLRRTEPPE